MTTDHTYQQQQQHFYHEHRTPYGPGGLPSPHSQFPPQSQQQPLVDVHRRLSQPQPTRQHSLSLPSTQQPLLKIPYPNLTLTLALIYVDRLKAKYPEAKGEPGCSHRLFLVAFIIAAKYRCSVELAAAAPPHRPDGDSPSPEEKEQIELEAEQQQELSLEARLNAELIFSNHAWVRLLNLGSFQVRSISSASSNHPGQMLPIHARSSVAQMNSAVSSPSVPPLASPTLSVSTTTTSATSTDGLSPITPTYNNTSGGVSIQLPSVATNIPSPSPSPVSPSTILQVEDLDRMEAEFLTFLNFDLGTLDHDLETCWNLLVGKYTA
ncbi:hypothetical protein BGZ83_004457 [Gryganskiella cystojenkinii]|nr:hypothetical protein BGZ83_004457 [Gryganskiella cystojenkinii]